MLIQEICLLREKVGGGRGQAVLGPHNAACLHIIIFIKDGMKYPDFNPKLHYFNVECKKKFTSKSPT